MTDDIPGDSRTNIGFITYDSSVHFYQIANNDGGQPKQLIVSDISGKHHLKIIFYSPHISYINYKLFLLIKNFRHIFTIA